MNSFNSQIIISQLNGIELAYYRLIILVSPPGKGKTIVLKEIQKKKKFPYINVNLELSKKLLELSKYQRKLRAIAILEEIVDGYGNTTVLLDNIELLFSPDLALNPLQLLKKLSRDRTIIATWNGYLQDKYLIYAQPNHPEYRKEIIEDIVIISPS